MAHIALANRKDETDAADMLAYAIVAIGETPEAAIAAVWTKVEASAAEWDEVPSEGDWLIVTHEA